jgi:reverse gyrase
MRSKVMYCTQCGEHIGLTRIRGHAMCEECFKNTKAAMYNKMKPVKLHSSLMPLLMDIAQTMTGVEEYVMVVEAANERIVVRYNDETEQIIFPF